MAWAERRRQILYDLVFVFYEEPSDKNTIHRQKIKEHSTLQAFYASHPCNAVKANPTLQHNLNNN